MTENRPVERPSADDKSKDTEQTSPTGAKPHREEAGVGVGSVSVEADVKFTPGRPKTVPPTDDE
jgi:hypothetical protein